MASNICRFSIKEKKKRTSQFSCAVLGSLFWRQALKCTGLLEEASETSFNVISHVHYEMAEKTIETGTLTEIRWEKGIHQNQMSSEDQTRCGDWFHPGVSDSRLICASRWETSQCPVNTRRRPWRPCYLPQPGQSGPTSLLVEGAEIKKWETEEWCGWNEACTQNWMTWLFISLPF